MANNYAREITLDDETRDRLTSYLDDELSRHYAERGAWIDQIAYWKSDYNAEPSTTEGTFPFRGSATLIIPLAAITVEAIHARAMTKAFALSQLIVAKPMSSKWSNHARPVEKFLGQELLYRIGIYKPINSSVLEIIKYGTGVAKDGYCKITKTAVREVEPGKEEEFTVVIKQNAVVDSVPLSRFLMPFQYQDVQEASWCGEEHEYTPYEVRLHEINGLFKEGTMEELNAHFSTNPSSGVMQNDDVQETQEKSEKREPVWPLKLKTVEIYLGFDIDQSEKFYSDQLASGTSSEELNNNFDKEIVVHYCPDAHFILSCRYNWNEDLRRPYHTGVYFPVEHRWAGIGVGKQVEQFQKEITTQHRQRIDNATLANCRMIKVSDLSKYGPDEPLFPGKMWFVNHKDDVESFSLGEIYPSAYSNESQSLMYVQQRTGVNEVNLGMPQVGTPGTATSDLARIQEGNKKEDFTYGNIKHFISEIVRATVLNIKQFGPKASSYYEVVEDGNLVKEYFAQDFEQIKNGMILEIALAGQQDNKLLDRQNQQQIAQLITNYYDSMVNLAKLKGDQNLMQLVITSGMKAGTEAIKQILEAYDFKNIDRIVVQELLNGNIGPNQTPSVGTNSGPQAAIPAQGSVQPPTAPAQVS